MFEFIFFIRERKIDNTLHLPVAAGHALEAADRNREGTVGDGFILGSGAQMA
jgi:hypothetical protein